MARRGVVKSVADVTDAASPEVERTVFVGGTVRSGSTLLAGLLAERYEGFNAGELHLLWRSFHTGRLCTCGVTVAECPFWSQVHAIVSAKLGPRGFAFIEAHEPRLRSIVSHGPSLDLDPDLVRLRRATEAAIREVSGRAVIVDSSKSPGTALVAEAAGRVDAVQLVRDPRAVVHSMRSPKADPSLRGELMPRLGTVRAAAYWALTNLAFNEIRRKAKVPIVRYEDLVVDEDVLRNAETGAVAGEHAIAGNPWRFSPGHPIEADQRWQRELSPLRQVVVAVLTAGSRRKVGY